MPRRNDIHRILIIGSGPIIIGQACEFDYSGAQACKALKADGYEVVLINSNPATIMTDPDLADRTYVEPLSVGYAEEVIRRERPDALLSTVGGQTGLNLVRRPGGSRRARQIRRGAHRRQDRIHQESRRPLAVQRCDAEDRPGDAAIATGEQHRGRAGLRRACSGRISRDPAAELHYGRLGRRHRLQSRRAGGNYAARSGSFAGARSPDRRERPRMEGIRAGGDARSGRQRHHRVLHRKLRSDGRAHRRFHYRSAGANSHRSRIPDDARRLASLACAKSASTRADRMCSSRSIRKMAAW